MRSATHELVTYNDRHSEPGVPGPLRRAWEVRTKDYVVQPSNAVRHQSYQTPPIWSYLIISVGTKVLDSMQYSAPRELCRGDGGIHPHSSPVGRSPRQTLHGRRRVDGPPALTADSGQPDFRGGHSVKTTSDLSADQNGSWQAARARGASSEHYPSNNANQTQPISRTHCTSLQRLPRRPHRRRRGCGAGDPRRPRAQGR